MTYSEHIVLDNDWCDFTQRIATATFDPKDCIHTPDCALPAMREVLFAACGIVLCAALVSVYAVSRLKGLRGFRLP